MALFKHREYLVHCSSGVFDGEHHPGTTAVHSGIYRCAGCAREITSHHGEPLPPQNHHAHDPAQGAIRWRLAVFTQHDPDETV